jgi:hypothetical protein
VPTSEQAKFIRREKMAAIRRELDEMAIHRGNLWDEYMTLNREIGLIEYHEQNPSL